MLGALGASWGGFGVILGRFWCPDGRIFVQFGSLGVDFGGQMINSCIIFDCSGEILGAFRVSCEYYVG